MASSRSNEAGIALLSVMLGLAVIAVLAFGITLVTRSGVGEAHTDLEASEMRAWFDAVVTQTAVSLIEKRGQAGLRVDGVEQSIMVMGQPVSVSVSSEFGKVDLNAANEQTFEQLFEAAGLGPAEATEEAGNIIAWRTAGSGIQTVRHFRIKSELLDLPGITENLYEAVLPAITVYSGNSRIDQSTAPLLALEAAGINRLSAESAIRDREFDRAQDQAGEVTGGKLAPGINLTEWAFQIDATLELNGQREHGTAVIRITGNLSRPFFVLTRDEIPN